MVCTCYQCTLYSRTTFLKVKQQQKTLNWWMLWGNANCPTDDEECLYSFELSMDGAICKHANRSMFVKPIYSLSVFELAFCLLAFARWADQKSIKNVPPPPPPSSTWWTRTFEFESFFPCSSTSVSMLTDWLAGELNFHYYRIISENQVWKNDSIPRKRKGTLERACPQTETAPRK